MTEQIRLRIDSQLAEEVDVVCREIGITPTAAVSMFFAQMHAVYRWMLGQGSKPECVQVCA